MEELFNGCGLKSAQLDSLISVYDKEAVLSIGELLAMTLEKL